MDRRRWQTLSEAQLRAVVQACHAENRDLVAWYLPSKTGGSHTRMYRRLRQVFDGDGDDTDSQGGSEENDSEPTSQAMAQELSDNSQTSQCIHLARAPGSFAFPTSVSLFNVPLGAAVFAADPNHEDIYYYLITTPGLNYSDPTNWQRLTKWQAQDIARRSHAQGRWLAAQHLPGDAANSLRQMNRRLQEVIGFHSAGGTY